MKNKMMSLLVASALSAFAQSAHAVPVFADIWYEFSFTDTVSIARGCFPADPLGTACTPSSGTPTTFVGAPSWTYTAGAGGAALVITDAFLIGDQFAIFDTGIFIGATSPVAIGGACGDDPLGCVGVASSGVFFLSAGLHTIDLVPLVSLGGGAAYFIIVEAPAAIPEPGTLLLLGAGLTGLCLMRRRK